MRTQRWLTEPLLTALLAVLLYLAWQLLYAANLAASGATPAQPYTSSVDFIARMALGVLWVAVPIAIWALLAIAGNRIVRKRKFPARALVALLAAAVLTVPFAIYFAVLLTVNDGWRGLGAISVAIPLIAPFFVLGAYCVVGMMLSAIEARRDATSTELHR